MTMLTERFGYRLGILKNLTLRACAVTGLPMHVLLGPSRDQAICQVRFAVMLIARRKGLSLNQIGAVFNWRHHTTVLNGLRRGTELLNDPGFAELVREIDPAHDVDEVEAA